MLTKTGNGLLLLTGSNGYSGGTTVNGGTLQMGLGDSNALGSTITAPLAMTSGLLDLNGNSLSVGAFSGSGTVNNVSRRRTDHVDDRQRGGRRRVLGQHQRTPPARWRWSRPARGNGSAQRHEHLYGRHDPQRRPRELHTVGLAVYDQPGQHHLQRGRAAIRRGQYRGHLGGIAPIAAGQAAIIDTGTNSVAFNSPLSGSGGLTKAGAGTLSLNVPNSFTGPTTVTGGTLNVGDPAGIALLNSDVAVNFNGVTGAPGTLSMSVPAATVGSLAGAGNVNLNSGQLTVGVKNTSTTFSGSILGAGTGFIKSGSGTMTLTGNSAYTGPTTIASGTLLLAQDPSTGIKFSTNRGGGTYTVTGEAGVVPMNNWANVAGLNVTGVAVNNNNNANVGTTVTVTTAGDNWDSYNGNQANQNAQLLNSYLDNTGGSMNVSVSGIPYASYSVYVYFNADGAGRPAAVRLNGATYYFNTIGGAGFNGFVQTTSTVSTTSPAANYAVFSGLSASSFTLTDSGSAANHQGIAAVEIVANGLAGGLNTLPVTTPVVLASGATLDLGGGTQTVASLSDATPGLGGTVQNSGATMAILTLSPPSGSTTFSGLIGGPGSLGNISLIMAGGGLQNLAGSNNYTGGTQVSGGTLQLGNAAALGTGALAANGGVFDLAGLSTTVPSFSGASGVVTNSVLATTSTLTVSQTGSTVFGGGLQNGAGLLALAFSGGNGGLLQLSGVNNYSGGTHILAGILQLGSNTAINGAGALTIDSGGLLDLNGVNAGVGALNGSGTVNNVAGYGTSVLTVGNGGNGGAFSGTIQNSGPNGNVAVVKTGSGTQYLSGVGTYTGGTTLSGGVLNFSASALGTGGITFSGGTLQYASGNTQDVSPAIASIGSGQAAKIDTNGNSVFFGSGLSGNGGLMKLGSGMLTLNAANSYLGTTTVSGGTLQLGTGIPGALPGGAVTANGGFLDLNGNSVTVSSLSSSPTAAGGTITNSTGPQATLTLNQTTSSTFGGSLADGGGGLYLTMNGSGMLTLTGVNTYSYTTAINAGVLKAGAPSAFAPIPTSWSRAARSTPATRRSRSTRSLWAAPGR